MPGYRKIEEHETDRGELVDCRHCDGRGVTQNFGCCHRYNGTSWGTIGTCCVCKGTGYVRV